jgi:tRNA(fMet)-specific endonuclease VapC
MKFLLDTNIISDMMQNPKGRAKQQLFAAFQRDPQATVCTSVVVDCELQFGLTKVPAPRRTAAYQNTIKHIEVLPIDISVVAHYATLRTRLERAGTIIGANDMLIAAHALALDCTLVTDNEDEFCRVVGLKVENWLKTA